MIVLENRKARAVEASAPSAQPARITQMAYTATAPSLRVPVTESNRELLRLLRAAELAAWEKAITARGTR